MRKAIVTIGTDGLRDFVTLPGGQRMMLGPVSMLKFVTELTPLRFARKVLDAFNQGGSAVVTVDLDAMGELLKPHVSRWGTAGDFTSSLIPRSDRTSTREGPAMADAKTLLERLGKIEGVVTLLDKHASGQLIAPKLHSELRSLVGGLHFYDPGDQSKNDAWYIDSKPVVDTADAGQKLPASATHGSAQGVKVETASPSTKSVYAPEPSTTPVYAPKTAAEVAPAAAAPAAQPSLESLKQNTGLADSIINTVEETSVKVDALVTAGRKFNASKAKEDLYAIASRVTEIVNNVDLAQPWVAKDLTALAKQAQYIHGLFASAKV
jgi:hypothetical protein